MLFQSQVKYILFIVLFWIFLTGCTKRSSISENSATASDSTLFPAELTHFAAYEKNPVFNGTGGNTWDQMIRERGFIIREDGQYHLWYTGYREGPDEAMHLGYATSPDGLVWTRYEHNPIVDSGWVEDVNVIKSAGTYYMFAEGRNDIAHLLTSVDRIHWKEQGPLDIRYMNGETLKKGAYGTPAAWLEGGIWYLFYERGDLGIWLAVSTDLKTWTNKQDEPVLSLGPESYDLYQVAMDQIIQYKGKYYGYYHASEYKDGHEWNSCVAVSEDLIHWKKYEKNPILRENKSSPILVNDGDQYRLYSMHPGVCLHLPAK